MKNLDILTVMLHLEGELLPDEKDGFHYASCYLPKYEWSDIFGFTEEEIQYYQIIIENNAHIIIELSKDGGIDNAASF